MDLNLPSAKETLPPEYAGSYFNNLDDLLQKGQKTQYDRSRMDLESAGLLGSRDEFTPAANEVLPGEVAQRKAFELPEVQRSYGMSRSERLASIAFEHQRQFADAEFQRRIYEMQVQANAQRALLEYKNSLQGRDGFDWGGTLGQVAGTAAGAYFGGPIGAAAGGSVGKGLFGRSGPVQR